jgi:predicted dehydrogenase
MNKSQITTQLNRRDFLKITSVAAAAASVSPYIITTHAAPDDPIKIGLVGCGGRGMGAIGNAIAAAGKNVKLVAIADLFPDVVEGARVALEKGVSSNAEWAKGTETTDLKGVDTKLDPAMCFSGWDAYKKLVAVPEINYVLLTTPPHFRHIHLKAAIEAGKNCFIEKPVAVDIPGCRSVIESGKLAKEKGLGILGGTQRRHSKNYQETIKRVQDGAIGKITSARAYWLQGSNKVPPARKPEWSEMEWELRNWLYYTWLSGDIIAEQHLHNIDVINWVLGTHPVKAFGMGGRAVRTGSEFGNVYDHFTVEFEYPDGVRMTSMCCQIDGVSGKISEDVVGTKGASNCMNLVKGETSFKFTGKFKNPYEQEHIDMIEGIRTGKPINEAQQIAESNIAAILGRESAYSGKSIDWDSAMESELSLSPEKYEFGPLPESKVALPGIYKFS